MRIRLYLFIALASVAAIPIALFGVWPHTDALEQEIEIVSENNLLIAKNLRRVLERYEQDVRGLFRLLASQAIGGIRDIEADKVLQEFHFRHICIATLDDSEVVEAVLETAPCPQRIPSARFELFKALNQPDRVSFSPVFTSPDGEPIIYLVTQIGNHLAVGAMRTDFFVELGRSVTFGEKGHAAIVDQTGQVLAHPNPAWVSEHRDISLLTPVRGMLAQREGAVQFFSPALQAEMIAGFTFVPGAGWGIMVPQPLAELEARARDAKLFALGVSLFGLLLAALVGWWLAGVITRPLAAVVQTANAMASGSRGARVQVPSGMPPREFRELAASFNAMADSVEQAMDAEAQVHAEISALVENSPAAIMLLTADGRFRLVNRRFCEWSGRAESELIGRNPSELFDADIARRMGVAGAEAVATGRSVELVLEDLPMAEAVRDLSVQVFPVFEADGRVSSVGAIMMDTTTHRAAELRQREASKMEAVGRLTGGVAHDFNNLLSIISGYAEILISMGGDVKRSALPIWRAAQRGAELTGRLLAFARKQKLAPTAVDVHVLAKEMSRLFSRTFGPNISVVCDVASDTHPVLADAGQLEAALLNLGINARDAMPNGGTICLAAENLVVAEGDFPELDASDYVAISVSDQGTGVQETEQVKIFEPFYSTKEVGKGSGLGLSMVYGFMQQSGGLVQLESQPDKGSRFTLILPRSPEAALPERAPDDSVADIELGGVRVLVLEDEPDVLELVSKMFVHLGVEVVQAQSGAQALRELEDDARITLMVSDVVLPGERSGFEIGREAQQIRPALTVFYMSGYALDALPESAPPTDDYVLLNKPFTMEALREQLQLWMNSEEGTQRVPTDLP